MKKSLFTAGLLLLLGSSPLFAQQEPEIITLRISDPRVGGGQIVVTRGEGKSEILPLENGISDKKVVKASETYYRLIKQLYQEGYVMQGIVKNGEDYSYTTVLFVKAPKP
jgi:hypothetical protein